MSSTQSGSFNSNRGDETQGTVHSSDADNSSISREIKTADAYTNKNAHSFDSSANSNIEDKLTSTAQEKTVSAFSCSISPIHDSRLNNTSRILPSIDEESSSENILNQDLFECILKAHENDIAQLAKDWVEEFNKNESTIDACEQFTRFFLRCAGYVHPHLPVHFTHNTMKRFVGQMDKYKMDPKCELDKGLFPSSSNNQKKTKFLFQEFIMHIIVLSSKQPMFRTNLLPFLLHFLMFKKSVSSQNRHTCAEIVLSIVEGLLNTYNYLLTHYDSLEARKEREKEKDPFVQSEYILSQIASKIEEVGEHVNYFEKQINFVLEDCFNDFLRDKDEKIVCVCLEYLQRWMCEHDKLFLTPSYLGFITRCVFHPNRVVRITCLQCLLCIFGAKNENKLVQNLYDTMKEKILLLTNDKSLIVAKYAIDSINKAYLVWENLVPNSHMQCIYTFIYSPFPKLSQASGKLLWSKLHNMTADSVELLVFLLDFHIEAEMSDDKIHLLVDAVYPLDINGVLVMWKNLLDILLRHEIHEKYKLNKENIGTMAKITVHLIRKAITGESKFTSATQPPENAKTRPKADAVEHQIDVTTLFLPKLPALINKFHTNIEAMIEIVSIPQYFILDVEISNPHLAEKFLAKLLQYLNSIVKSASNDTLLFQCFRTLDILSKNPIFQSITKPSTEVLVYDIVADGVSYLERFLNKLKLESVNNNYVLTEADVQDLNFRLRRLNCMIHFHDFVEEYEKDMWAYILDLLSCFVDVSYENYWHISESIMQIPNYCIRIGVQMVLQYIEDIDEYHKREQQNVNMHELFTQLITIIQCSKIFIVKIYAFEGIMHLMITVNNWNIVMYAQEEEIVLKYLEDHIFIKSIDLAMDTDEIELKEQEKCRRSMVEKLCHHITRNTVLPSIFNFVYSKILEFEEEYGEVIEQTFEEHMKTLDELDKHGIKEENQTKFLFNLLEKQFGSIDASSKESIENFENLTHKWSTCIPIQSISSKRMLALQQDGIDFAFGASDQRGLEFLRGLGHFSYFLNDKDKIQLIKVLGLKTKGVNKLKKQDRECISFYKSVLETAVSKRATKKKFKLIAKEAQDLPDDSYDSDDSDEEERCPSLVESSLNTSKGNDKKDVPSINKSSRVSSSSSILKSPIKRKDLLEIEENASMEAKENQQKKQKFDSNRKKTLDNEWKSSSGESIKSSHSRCASLENRNNTPLSSSDENTDTSVISPSKAKDSGEKSALRDTEKAYSVSTHMTRSKSRSLSSQSSMSLDSDIPSGV